MASFVTSYKSLRNCVYSTKYHFIFCPKYRRSVLSDTIAERLKSIILEVSSELHSDVIEMEVMPDHVHLLVEVPPPIGILSYISKVKGRSARLLRAEFPELKKKLPCLWTSSYFCATVGGAPLEIVKQYVANQKNV
jgi:putative transposase